LTVMLTGDERAEHDSLRSRRRALSQTDRESEPSQV
jgi:hypothetical protein